MHITRLLDGPIVEPATHPSIGANIQGPSRDARGGNDSPHRIADVLVDDERRQLVMYFHGLEALGWQLSRAAVSTDGVSFAANPEILGRPYFRAFRWDDQTYVMAMPGVFFRSADGLSVFEEGPTLFPKLMRHSALLVRDATLHVFWTRVGDAPESILHSTIELTAPPTVM